MNEFLTIFPFIHQTQLALEKQNKLLNRVTLTGKINALDIAANLFEFTDRTTSVFDEIKTNLIDALLEENIHKIQNELDFKSKTLIDILIRNLFERTADVGFLATDSVIIDFLQKETVFVENMKGRLIEYTQKYSVYNDVIILDTLGNVKVNIHPQNNPIVTKDSILREALESDSYIEVYKKTDLFESQDKTLIFAQKIVSNQQTIGVLCLCFKFDDELQRIFAQLSHGNEQLAILDNYGILKSNSKKINIIKYSDAQYNIVDKKYFTVTNKTNSYQGYSGISTWYSIAQSTQIDSKTNDIIEDTEEKEEIAPSLLNDNLKNIIEEANNLVEDIADVIINGELIAAKNRAYVLTPILENLRNISATLLQIIHHSALNLDKVAKESLIHDVKMTSHLAIDIMDRNLYERANDCRWWALTPLFINELSSVTPNIQRIQETLKYINELYTVYTNIFIYNSKGVIVAASLDDTVVGQKVSEPYVQKTLTNKVTQNYFVSDFNNTELYNNKATYIYSASIKCTNNETFGIAVVFDSEPEFKAMLNDSFPKNQKGFSAFVDANKKIIATNSSFLKVFDTLDIDDKYFEGNNEHAVYDFILLNGMNYIMAIVQSKGYREYKTEDNYKNTLYAATFIEIE